MQRYVEAGQAVNPKHYDDHPSGVECIDVIRYLPYSAGNAIKYLWRAGQKDNTVQDLNKALWYVRDCMAYPQPYRGLDWDAISKWYEAETAGYRKTAISRIFMSQYTQAETSIKAWLYELQINKI